MKKIGFQLMLRRLLIPSVTDGKGVLSVKLPLPGVPKDKVKLHGNKNK